MRIADLSELRIAWRPQQRCCAQWGPSTSVDVTPVGQSAWCVKYIGLFTYWSHYPISNCSTTMDVKCWLLLLLVLTLFNISSALTSNSGTLAELINHMTDNVCLFLLVGLSAWSCLLTQLSSLLRTSIESCVDELTQSPNLDLIAIQSKR